MFHCSENIFHNQKDDLLPECDRQHDSFKTGEAEIPQNICFKCILKYIFITW